MPYIPTVSWETEITTVTPTGVANYYKCNIPTLNLNDPGAGDIQIGYYIIDYLGYVYKITDTNVDGDSEKVEVFDINEGGKLNPGDPQGPYDAKTAFVYKANLDGSLGLSQAQIRSLSIVARDNANYIDNNIIWQNRGISVYDTADTITTNNVTKIEFSNKFDVTTGTETEWESGNVLLVDTSASSIISFGNQYEIPYTNATTDDFDYTSTFTFDGDNLHLLGDNKKLYFGAGDDAYLTYTGTRSEIVSSNVKIHNSTDSYIETYYSSVYNYASIFNEIIVDGGTFYCDYTSYTTASGVNGNSTLLGRAYGEISSNGYTMGFTGSVDENTSSASFSIYGAKDLTNECYLTVDELGISFEIGSAASRPEICNIDSSGLHFDDNYKTYFGTGDDVTMFFDGTWFYITNDETLSYENAYGIEATNTTNSSAIYQYATTGTGISAPFADLHINTSSLLTATAKLGARTLISTTAHYSEIGVTGTTAANYAYLSSIKSGVSKSTLELTNDTLSFIYDTPATSPTTLLSIDNTQLKIVDDYKITLGTDNDIEHYFDGSYYNIDTNNASMYISTDPSNAYTEAVTIEVSYSSTFQQLAFYSSKDISGNQWTAYGDYTITESTPKTASFESAARGYYNGNTAITYIIGTTSASSGATLELYSSDNTDSMKMTLASTNVSISGSNAIGQELLSLDQNDADQAFIDYQGTSAASIANNITTYTTGNSIQGFVKIEINGTSYWMPYYNAPTS